MIGFDPGESNISWLMDDEMFAKILAGPEINGLWHNALDKMRDRANEMAQTEGAEYGSAVHEPDNQWGFEPGGYIYAKNFKARVDMYYHSTLLNVIAEAPHLIEEAMDLGNNQFYDPTGRGSNVRDRTTGRFAPSGGIKKGGRKS